MRPGKRAFLLLPTIALLPLVLASAQAKTETYAFTLNAKSGIAQPFTFEVNAAGTIKVQATWSGTAAKLTLVLNGPGQAGYYQRADGPSPLQVSQEVTQAILAKGTTWKVSVADLNRSGQATGSIQLDYPEAPKILTLPELPKVTKLPVTPGPLQPHVSPLATWLSAHPGVTQAIVWEGHNAPTAYPSWPDEKKTALEHAYNVAANRLVAIANDPPANLAQVADPSYPMTILSETDAWNLFVDHVGHSLAAEINHWVAWSVAQYPAQDLALLFDSRQMFRWNAVYSGYQIEELDGVALPAPPRKTYDFVTNNNLIGPDRLATIARLLDWCRSNLYHFSGAYQAKNMENQWQYRGFPPVSRMIAGTPFIGQENQPWGGIKHRTAGCHGTSGFLRAVLRMVNIPAKEVEIGGHALVSFPSEGKYLSHADDPYNRLSSAVPPIPAGELLIDQTKFNAWFGSGVSEATQQKNVGRRPIELAIQYLPNYLLSEYCADRAANRSHVDGRIYAIFKNAYTVADLEATDLWGRMDTKIASFGGCSGVPQ